MKIRQKLALLVIVPVAAVLAFATLAIVTTGGEALRAEQLRGLTSANEAAGVLVYNLQSERMLTAQVLTSKSDEKLSDAYNNQIVATDKAMDGFKKSRRGLSGVPDRTLSTLKQVDTEYKRLDAIREDVGVGKKPASAAAFAYRITIADLLSYRESVPQVSNSATSDQIRAATTLSRIIEYQSIESEVVVRALAGGKLADSTYQEITTAYAGSSDSSLTFDTVASAEWRGLVDQSQTGSKMATAKGLEDQALRSTPGRKLKIDKDQWVTSMKWRADKAQKVQKKIDAEVVRDVTALRDQQYRSTGIQVAGVLLAVLLALFLALRLGSPVVRGLRRLRDSAHHVATEGLPAAVAQLEDVNVLGEQSPDEFAEQATPPMKIRGRDELADVGRAFNEVHQEAIRVAAHQALLRLHIGAMFVRLARRGHSLSGRLTSVLDEAERNEQDPDRLERLFALDHLVTLFGRTNDSLLVLGGASPAKARAANETVGNVVTAAQSQIEQYQRVQIGAVDEGISVKAAAVDDVAKLLAELMDNATRYSEHTVNVTARLLADRLVVQINDRGMGIPEERMAYLNSRLASQTPLDLEAIQTMGLTVVGNLAALHGIKVELRSAATGGTLAEVSLPVSILEQKPVHRELPAAEEPKQPQRAPLFARRKRRQSTAADLERNRQFDGGAPAGSRNQLVPQSDLPASSRFSADGAAGMPVLRFDWGTNRVDSGQDESHTGVMPAVSTDESPRRRGFAFGANDAANEGWSAAQRVSQFAQKATEDDGLPKREPMAQLVPGSMEARSTEAPSAQAMPAYRDPATVGATYSAYVRARGRNRSQSPTDRSRNTP